MGFNYAKEKEKFDCSWAVLRQQYEAAGMSLDAINKLYDFDWNWFKSRRKYFNWLAVLPESMSVEDLPQEGAEMALGGQSRTLRNGRSNRTVLVDRGDRRFGIAAKADAAVRRRYRSADLPRV